MVSNAYDFSRASENKLGRFLELLNRRFRLNRIVEPCRFCMLAENFASWESRFFRATFLNVKPRFLFLLQFFQKNLK